MERILIDAVYTGETRVAVLNGNNILENFDYETNLKKILKGNIYLGKVTRIEPSLQAAFVEYGGNKQGFLPFSEINPDYYNIPVKSNDWDEAESVGVKSLKDVIRPIKLFENIDNVILEASQPTTDDNTGDEEKLSDDKNIDEVDENESGNTYQLYRKNKIQEVIRKNQYILVQVVKEERGNKGVTLTTYLSLAGRFCVLMPNSPKKSGISRRISEGDVRRKIRNILHKINLPSGCAVIVRTAGADRSEAEIIRDYDYLIRLWNNIYKHANNLSIPSFIHEESSLIKRFIRDTYVSTIKEILVHGESAYYEARNFMKMIMPLEYHCVKLYRSKIPIFTRFKLEEQISELYKNIVSLTSGGYLVINITEALIAIDVNSGKATSEKNVEETAIKTNIEAANEIVKQIVMRDLSGIIVIDFIDMEEIKNRLHVEKIMKNLLNKDRARIQIGRISEFGVLEMSRQRVKASYHETHNVKCHYCTGSGYIRSKESIAIAVLRAISHEASFEKIIRLIVNINASPAVYILNNKRKEIQELEEKYNLQIVINDDDSKISHDNFDIEKVKQTEKEKQEKIEVACTSLDNLSMTDLEVIKINDGLDDNEENNRKKDDNATIDLEEYENEAGVEKTVRKNRHRRHNNYNQNNNRRYKKIVKNKNDVKPQIVEKKKNDNFLTGIIKKFIK